MRRFPLVTFSSILLLIALLALSACGGGSSSSSGGNSNSGVTQIVMTPTTSAIDPGATVQVTATPEDAGGTQVTKATPAFSVAAGQSLITVSQGGLVCAGHWDSLTTPVVCTPATGSGEAIVTATVGTITGQTKIVVLPQIDNVSIVPIAPDPAFPADPAGLACISQLTTRTFTAQPSFKGVPVTITDQMKDAAVVWSIGTTTVGTIAAQTSTDSSGNTITDTRVAIATAKVPGRTQVTASIGSHQSTPADFITCPISQIVIADSATPPTTLPLAASGTFTLAPTMTDSRGSAVTQSTTDSSGTSTPLFSLGWNSSQILVASVSSGVVTGASANPGATTVTASCTSPNCNMGLGAIYSNAFVVPVAGTSAGVTVYVGSSDPTAGKTLLPVTTADNKVGTAITLGDVPNSMLFDRTGSSLYVGTASGLIVVNGSNGVTTSPLTTAPGKVLAISPDASTVFVSNGTQVFVVTTTSGAVQALNIPGATAAKFTPDGSKAYIVGGGRISVYTSSTFPNPQSLSGAIDVSFLADNIFGYIADDSGLSVRATCNDLNTLLPSGGGAPSPTSVSLSPVPTFVRALPDGLHLVTATSPDMNLVTVTTDGKGYVNPVTGCAPAISNTVLPATLNGGTAFTPRHLIVTSDGKHAFVLSDAGTLLGATIDVANGTLTPVSIPLQSSVNGTAQPTAVQQTTGGATLDGNLVFFGGNDNQLHRVDLTAATPADAPIVLTGAPTGFTADFVAVQP